MLAPYYTIDVHELEHIHVALILDFSAVSKSTQRFSFTDLSRLSISDFAFGAGSIFFSPFKNDRRFYSGFL